MELWIRSQDKTRLIKVEDLYMVEDKDNFTSYIGISRIGHIAEYKKVGRALEVLDEIQKYITPTLSLLDDTLNGKQVCQVGNILAMVYEMPKE